MRANGRAPARYLKVLLIDDAQPLWFQSRTLGDFDRKILPPLEQITWSQGEHYVYGIDSLDAAVSYWTSFSDEIFPDVVLSDVNFENDLTTPLQYVGDPGSNKRIPTGLSHCKPFAAIARARSRPLAIAIFTQDPTMWGRFIFDSEHDAVFGLLAAHEALEIAAILGEPIKEEAFGDHGPVWSWLAGRHAVGIHAARDAAIATFRKLLFARLTVPLDSGAHNQVRIPLAATKELEAWCADMEKNPQRLGQEGIDPGLSLIFSDGSSDCVFFASLFADVSNIERAPLPADCYSIPAELSGEAWRLVDGLPAIGSLVKQICTSVKSIHHAFQCLRDLPLDAARLGKNLRDVTADKEARGFAVLFRAIEIKHEEWREWACTWAETGWNPLTGRGIDDVTAPPWTKPIKEWIEDVVEIVGELRKSAKREEAAFEREEVIDRIMDLLLDGDAPVRQKRDAAIWLLDFAIAIGVVLIAKSESLGPYEVGSAARNATLLASVPEMPGSILKSASLGTLLRDYLGFGARGPVKTKNDNAIGQILFEAFLEGSHKGESDPNKKAGIGRKFLIEFERGDVTELIKLRCREFCIDVLHWNDRKDWPFSLS